MKRRTVLVITGSLAIVLALIVGLGASDGNEPAAPELGAHSPSSPPAGQARGEASPPALADQDETAPPAALPNSLEGSQPDGAISAEGGHLVISIELRRLFDYFLSATGEEPLATIRARIVATLRKRLPPTAVDEAIVILDRYLAYRDIVRDFPPVTDVNAQLDRLHDLRIKIFAPEVATAFFAAEEAGQHLALARRDVMLDHSLPPEERARRLAELDEREPAESRAARAAAIAPIEQMKREDAMRAAGASDRDIELQRTAALGAETAARLAELDHARAAWQARLDEFRTQRAALLADAALNAAERQRRIDDLLERSFSPPERLRVEALDRIAAQAGSP